MVLYRRLVPACVIVHGTGLEGIPEDSAAPVVSARRTEQDITVILGTHVPVEQIVFPVIQD